MDLNDIINVLIGFIVGGVAGRIMSDKPAVKSLRAELTVAHETIAELQRNIEGLEETIRYLED